VRPVLREAFFIDVMRLSPMVEKHLVPGAANTYQLLTKLPAARGRRRIRSATVHGSLTALALADGGRAALVDFRMENRARFTAQFDRQAALVSGVRHPPPSILKLQPRRTRHDTPT